MRSIGFNATEAALRLPISLVLLTRSDPGASAVGASLLAPVALNAAALFSLSFPCTMEDLRKQYAAKRAAGQSRTAARVDIEQRWYEAARRHGFPELTALDIAFGTALIAGGMYLLLAPAGVLNMDRQDQTTWGALLAGFAIPALIADVWSFSATSGAGWWWRLYRRTEPGSPSSLEQPAITVVPTAHGVAGMLSASF
jgi:hypothetical protein